MKEASVSNKVPKGTFGFNLLANYPISLLEYEITKLTRQTI